MSDASSDGTLQPLSSKRPTRALPLPNLTIEITAAELKALISHHDSFGAYAEDHHDHDTASYHRMQAGNLRQYLVTTVAQGIIPAREAWDDLIRNPPSSRTSGDTTS